MAKGTKPEGGDGGAPKPAGKAGGDAPAAAAAAAGEEVVISAPMHCAGCARKLRRSLQRGSTVIVDSTTDRVVLRGPKAAENAAGAVKVVERRTGRKAVLVSPAPEKLPPAAAAKGEKTKKGNENKDKDVTNELPEINMKMVVILRINLHCDACCEEIKQRILRIKGVEDAVPHLKSSQMMVKGVVEPATLVGFIHSRTGRKAAIFRAEPLEPPPPAPKSPPKGAPPVEAQTKKDDPSDNTGDKKDGQENGNKEEEESQEEKKGGGGEEDKNPPGGDAAAEEQQEEETHGGAAKEDAAAGDDGVVLENHKKDDRLFTVPLPAGVVTVAPEEALDHAAGAPYSYSYSYPYPSYYPYAYAHPYQYQYQPQPYYPPPYAYAGGPDVYGWYPPEPFTEENPNACAIV